MANLRTEPQVMLRTGSGKEAAVLVIVVVAVIATLGFAVILAAVLLVTIGVHQEEKRLTFARRRGPTGTARVARLIVGRYVRRTEPDPQAAGWSATAPATPSESAASGHAAEPQRGIASRA
jgi:hypothetical protein